MIKQHSWDGVLLLVIAIKSVLYDKAEVKDEEGTELTKEICVFFNRHHQKVMVLLIIYSTILDKNCLILILILVY